MHYGHVDFMEGFLNVEGIVQPKHTLPSNNAPLS